MDNLAQEAAATPDWLVAEMPPGYQNRLEEIERLTRDLQAMWRFGRLLWASGPLLSETVRDVFATLKLSVESVQSGSSSFLVIHLENNRRLLLHVSSSQEVIEKKSADVAEAFRLLHEFGGEHDRAVLVANPHAVMPPAMRPEGVAPEALTMLKRLGVNVLSGPGAFQLWMLALQDPERALRLVDRLHEQDGGVFAVLPTGKAA
jgi:hypothetical protein